MSSTELAMETSFSQYALLAGSGGGPSVKGLNGKYNIAAVLGYPENVDEDLSALYTANPT